MSFDDLPAQPAMILPGANEYADYVLARSKKVAAASRTVMDVAYGEDYWQKVDFYLPDDTGARDLPVFCMIHGGAFRAGYKEWMGFQAPPIVSLPAVYVSISYRLAPTAKFPAIAEDCFEALRLVYERVVEHGGDPDRIFVGGHSAGAHLAALLALRRDWCEARGMPADVVKGCFPVSGIYDLEQENIVPGSVLERTFPEIFADPSDAPGCSPIAHVDGNTTPFFVTWGSEDLPDLIESSKAFVAALRRQPCVVETHVWDGYGHFEANITLEKADDPWVVKLREWLAAPPHAA